MSTEILLPQLGFSMAEGKLVEWLVPDGSTVNTGDLIYSLETDKSVTEVESPASGVLRISAAVDETYDVGSVLGVIE